MKKSVVDAASNLGDSISSKIGVIKLPWIIRMILAICWDLFDISTRVIVVWILGTFFPPLKWFIRGVLDMLLVVNGVVLWGAVGFIEFAEGLGEGFMYDLIPILSVGGVISRYRDRKKTGGEAIKIRDSIARLRNAAETEFPMAVVFTLLGFLFTGVTWWFGAISLSQTIGILILFVFAGFLIRYLGEIEIPEGVMVGAISIVGLILVLSVGAFSYNRFLKSPEDFRIEVWNQMKEQGDFQYKAAETLDVVAEKIHGTTGGIIDGAKEKFSNWWNAQEKRVRASEKNRKLEKPIEKKEENTQVSKAEENRSKKEAAELKLSPALSRLYRSNYVLDRAKELRGGKISFWQTLSLWTFGIMLFLTALLYRPRRSSQITPGLRAPDDSVDEWI